MKSFCFNCFSECDAVLHERKMKHVVKDDEVEFVGKYLVCPICGEEASNDEISEENLKKSFNEYKVKNGLLTSEDIIKARKTLGITQIALAKELSFGVKTLSRYENGRIQTVSQDRKIREYFAKKSEMLSRQEKKNSKVKCSKYEELEKTAFNVKVLKKKSFGCVARINTKNVNNCAKFIQASKIEYFDLKECLSKNEYNCGVDFASGFAA